MAPLILNCSFNNTRFGPLKNNGFLADEQSYIKQKEVEVQRNIYKEKRVGHFNTTLFIAPEKLFLEFSFVMCSLTCFQREI